MIVGTFTMYMNKKYNIEVSWRHLAETIDKGHTEKT